MQLLYFYNKISDIHISVPPVVWWSGVMVAHWSRSTKLTDVGPG